MPALQNFIYKSPILALLQRQYDLPAISMAEFKIFEALLEN